MSAKKSKPKQPDKTPSPNRRMISENRKARHRYEILEHLECGLILRGSEVKSLRDGKVSLDEAYVRLRDNALWLVGADIPEYKQATIWNHEPKRPRELLVHANQARKMAGRIQEKGLTLIPLAMYFNERGIAKVSVGICRGKKLFDKRQTLRTADAKRQIERASRRKS
jgi:SsrA-binding protein